MNQMSVRIPSPAKSVAIRRLTPIETAVGTSSTPPLPGVYIMGSGYDVFGEWASPSDVTVSVFDWSKATWQESTVRAGTYLPDVITEIPNTVLDYTQTSGQSIATFQKNISSKTKVDGSYNFFSGSITANFDSNTRTSSENAFARTQNNVNLYDLAATPSDLKPFLKADITELFESDGLTEADVRSFFEFHGVYFITGLSMGGTAVMVSSTQKTESTAQYDLAVSAELSYKGATGQLSASEEAEYKTQIDTFNSNSRLALHAAGGDPALAQQIAQGKFDDWVTSVTLQPAFINFRPQASLTAYADLIDNPTNRDLFRKVAATYLSERSREKQLFATYLTAVKVIYGDDPGILPPEGYQKIYIDLNQGARGKYIYLCYHAETPEQGATSFIAPLAELAVILNDTPTPVGFTKIAVDLNKGARGNFVYLCYKIGTADAEGVEAAIKDLRVITSPNSDVPAPYGFERIDVDLNSGTDVHDRYIYLCTSTKV